MVSIMIDRILVAYASQKGSTAEIAEVIGNELRSRGYAVEVREMRQVRSLDGYQAVVLGAPFYMGRIIEMGRFVDGHRLDLAARTVAAFAVGTAPVSRSQQQVRAGMKTLRETFGSLSPVAMTLFAGKIDPARLSFSQRTMIGISKAPVGDFRDWKAISAWASDLAGKLGG